MDFLNPKDLEIPLNPPDLKGKESKIKFFKIMSRTIIYTTKTCPKCEILKRFLSSKNISYKTEDMSQPQALTELRLNGIFTLNAPILQIDNTFVTCDKLFDGNEINIKSLKDILLKFSTENI